MSYGFVKIVKTGAKTDDWRDRGYGLKSGEGRDGRWSMKSCGYVLNRTKLAPELADAVMKEAEAWVIADTYDHSTYNEGHDSWSCDKGTSLYDISSFGCYVIVTDGHFGGVALTVEKTSGNGWNGSSYEGCCILLPDGTVIGDNEKTYHFSGEETETNKTDVYTLKKREG